MQLSDFFKVGIMCSSRVMHILNADLNELSKTCSKRGQKNEFERSTK